MENILWKPINTAPNNRWVRMQNEIMQEVSVGMCSNGQYKFKGDSFPDNIPTHWSEIQYSQIDPLNLHRHNRRIR